MLIVQICIGSSCHLKGSHELVEKIQSAIAEYHLEDDITLSGSFCIGKCNREGVTIQVNDDIHIGITPENFDIFFKEHILDVLHKGV
ncbi:MAG: (2Fe-2S) ferredoxin domain-containing protein [Clostridia bacterium]|nr:(2Fe-2S) ferredoxin domain-containing protein [Clostridia bacterium]